MTIPVLPDVTQFDLNDVQLAEGVLYSVSVRAENNEGLGPPSNAIEYQTNNGELTIVSSVATGIYCKIKCNVYFFSFKCFNTGNILGRSIWDNCTCCSIALPYTGRDMLLLQEGSRQE